jgi:ketosteroid isomerase-like protein
VVVVSDDLSLIQQVLVRYANAIDELDFDALSTVFTPDVRASYSGGPWLQGIDAIVEHISGLRTFAATFHFMGNMQIDVDGDRATAMTRSMTHLIAPDGVLHARALRYRDRLVRTDAGWRIAERVHTAQWMWEGTATVFTPGAR